MDTKQKKDIEWNIKTHNALAKKYEKMHGEIYNPHEQLRLLNELRFAVSLINVDSVPKVALDFGCGAGNLTTHLSNLGCDVIASDVSQGFLDLVVSREYNSRVESLLLNGNDLSEIPDSSVDLVATYSVLHHIPNYLAILSEFMRILKPGGIVYIDHEPSESFWKNNDNYEKFLSEVNKNTRFNYSKFFVLSNYIDWFIRNFINSRYHREGDIHVFSDDHVEWPKVISTLIDAGAIVVKSEDYLLFRRHYENTIYDKYKNLVNDMHFVIVQKKNVN